MTCLVPAPQVQFTFADMMPLSEAGVASPGRMDAAPRADHQHPRLTSAQSGVLDNTGTAVVVFKRVFDAKPAVSVLAVENNTRAPPDFKVKSFSQDASGKYTGCTIYGTRPRTLPAMSAVVTDLLKLANYDTTEPAVGVEFSLIALQPSP